jgi:predicted nuclease of predicted toxin-antitoxin system
MWLLDVNMPKKVADLLGEFGIQAQAADARGWKGLTNGALVEAAVQAGFSCVVTRDRLFSESAARALKRFPQFGVVLVDIPQLRGPAFLAQFRAAWSRNPIQPVGGELLRWPYA